MPQYPKTRETWPLDGHYTWVSLILCKMISWRLGNTFGIFLPMSLGIRVRFGPNFPKVPWCPKYPKTSETLLSNAFYTRVWLQFMWNVELNTFDEFSVYPSLWFRIFGPNFLDLLQFPKYTKRDINRSSDGFYIWVRFHLMWNVEFSCLDDFLCILSYKCMKNSPRQISPTIVNNFLKKAVITKPKCISNTVNIKTNNKTASSL